MNVLVFDTYPGNFGGNQKHITLLIKHMRANVRLAVPFRGKLTEALEDEYSVDVVCPPRRLMAYGRSLGQGGGLAKLLDALALLAYNARLFFYLLERRVDVIHCNNLRSLLCIGLAAKALRKPCVWYVKDDFSHRILDRIGFALADRVLFISEGLKKTKNIELITRYGHKIGFLPIGIELEGLSASSEELRETRATLSLDNEHINIIAVGYIVPEKGFHFLVEALADVVREYPEIRLYIVGGVMQEGYAKYLQNLARGLGIEEHIIYTGWRRDVLTILACADIFVLPSLSEGVPRSIVEAMGLGKPVVATAVGGVPELVLNEETGWLVPARDVKALAKAIIKLARDEEMRLEMGRKAKEIALRDYSIRRHVGELEKIFAELKADAAT